jgi:type IV secretion system protein VirB4
MKKKTSFRTASVVAEKKKTSEYELNSSFIPYVCHYNESTILTKNGELLKVIKITGENSQSIQQGIVDIRQLIRNSIKSHLKSNDFAFWVHTIRRKKNILLQDEFKEFLPKKINEKWNEENKWNEVYINELYLSVIVQINPVTRGIISKFKEDFFSIFPPIFRGAFKNNLNKSYSSLANIVDEIKGDLDQFGAKILSIYQKDGGVFSEPMSFFSKILNLSDEKYPLMYDDISEGICNNSKISLDKDIIKIKKDDKDHFASIFSIKEYHETSADFLDKFLQLPQELIITQSIDFVDKEYAIKEFEHQNYVLDVSKGQLLKDVSGLKDIVEENKGSQTDYAEHQITVTVIGDSEEDLRYKHQKSISSLHQLGIVIAPEEIFLEHCFWARLPANFSFICRKKITNISKIGGLASLHNLPFGKKEDSKWGEAICILRTAYDTPYYLNFHKNVNENGHIMIVGPKGSGKTVLLNFIISQSRKFRNKIFYFDCHHRSSTFICALAGKNFVSSLKPEFNNLKLNPLLLKKTKTNLIFLCRWFLYLVSYGKNRVTSEELALITKIVPKIFQQNIKNIKDAAELFNNPKTKNIYKKLSIWHGDGKYAFIFDNANEINLDESIINAFDITALLNKLPLLLPVFFYILHKVEQSLTGDPTLIILDEAWLKIKNKSITKKILNFQQEASKKNALIIFSLEASKDLDDENVLKLLRKISTSFFMPNPNPNTYYEDLFDLDENEIEILSSIKDGERFFLLKQKNSSIVMKLCLEHLGNNILKIISGDKRSYGKAKKYMNKYGKKPDEWLPEFIK